MTNTKPNFNFDDLFEEAFGDKDISKDARIAIIKFREFLEALSDIHDRLIEIERKIIDWEPDDKNATPMKDLQRDFARETNLFHQQTYSTVSVFVRVLLHITPKKFSATIPQRSLKKFLDFIKNKKEFSTISSQIEALEDSRDFRANFIDHPQSTKDYDWMTLGYLDEVLILYFHGRGRGYFITFSHKMDDRKKPIELSSPFPAEEWKVPPHHNQVFLAVWGLVSNILKEFKYI